MKYIPWGGDNQMPYNIIDLIESDETLSSCQIFNAEVCYGSGLVYDTELVTAQVQAQVDDFMLDNDLASYFLGVCQDFKHFGFFAKLLTIEHRLETEFFSLELMDMLRTANALNKWDMTLDTAQYKRMYQRISAIEFSILRIGEYPIPSISTL